MRISTKGRYGVRFMMDLANHGQEGNVPLKEIADRQDISEKYLWQVATPLKKEGLISAAAGPGGGYSLARPATTITLRNILAVLEGDNALVACTQDSTACPNGNACAAQEIWKEVDEKLAAVLDSFTLAEMAEKQRRMEQRFAKEYCI